MIYTILLIAQVVIAISLVVLILLQHGKGADAGAAFGNGASGTVFGAKGSANFMSRATAALATLFFVSSLTLAYLVNGAGGASGDSGSITDQLQKASASQQAPATSGGQPSNHGSSAGNASGSSANSKNNGPKIPD